MARHKVLFLALHSAVISARPVEAQVVRKYGHAAPSPGGEAGTTESGVNALVRRTP